jgi:hypothetical protein
MTTQTHHDAGLTLNRILNTWWPLAISWLFMGLELPALSSIVARLPEPKINLAAYGGVVYPLALIIESPIIMLLAASTALSKDWDSYQKIRKFMMWTSAILTGMHILIAFTPVYYLVVEKLIGAPVEIVEPARIGLMIMLPWTWAIAYRRFNQGMLIRFGHPRVVSIGTAIRLTANILVLITGFSLGTVPGIIVATSAIVVGVTTEAIFVGFRIRPVIRQELKLAPLANPSLTFKSFTAFYIPLAMTSLISLIVQPIGSAALSRMPQALDSLAVWPVVTGFIFLMRGMGIAFNEVVVSLIDERLAYKNLYKFTLILAIGSSLIILLMNATPLADIWFGKISALSLELTRLAHTGLWLAILMPGLNALQSWYQGTILSSKKTNGITEAVIVFIITISTVLWIGVAWNEFSGLYVGLVAFELGMLMQTIWLWYRSRPAFQKVKEREDLKVMIL